MSVSLNYLLSIPLCLKSVFIGEVIRIMDGNEPFSLLSLHGVGSKRFCRGVEAECASTFLGEGLRGPGGDAELTSGVTYQER